MRYWWKETTEIDVPPTNLRQVFATDERLSRQLARGDVEHLGKESLIACVVCGDTSMDDARGATYAKLPHSVSQRGALHS
jgi:hypothetical protein